MLLYLLIHGYNINDFNSPIIIDFNCEGGISLDISNIYINY